MMLDNNTETDGALLPEAPEETPATAAPAAAALYVPALPEQPGLVLTGQNASPAEPPPAPTAPQWQKPQALEQPPQPAEGTPAQEQQVYWHHLLTGDPDTVPNDVRRRAGAEEPSLTEEQRDYRVCSAINRSWVVDHRGLSREEVAARWPELRRQLAAELGVGDTEEELYLGLSARGNAETLRRAGRRVYERAYLAGLHGEDSYDVADITAELMPEDRPTAEGIGTRAYAEAQAVRARLQPVAATLAEGMDAFAAMEEDFLSAPRVIAAAPQLWQAAGLLPDLPEEERRLVMYLAATQLRQQRAQQGEAEEGVASRAVRAVRRGAAGLGMGIAQGIGNTLVATADSVGYRWGGESGAALQQDAAEWDARLRTLREIRHLAQQEVLPLTLPGAPAAEEYLMTAAESIPAAVMACAGGAGFLTLTAAGMGDAVAEARLRSPETPQHLQLAAGVVAGAVQAGIFMGISRIGGKLLERSINNFMRARGAGAAAFSWAALNSLAGLTAEGVKAMMGAKLASLADFAGQELASRVAGTASNINWQQYGDNMTDIEVNMREAAAMLPFLLIGAGKLSLRHFRSPQGVLGEGRRLLEWGADETQVRDMMNEPDLTRQNDMLQRLLRGTEVFSGPGFLEEAVRALGLLNMDYFKGFAEPAVVRDFLKLPAESSRVQRPDFGVRTQEQILATPDHARERSGVMRVRNTKQYREVLALWDEWWTRSHITEYSSRVALGTWEVTSGNAGPRYERSSRYLRELLQEGSPVPRRMHNAALYAPHAEAERRALLRDRVAELQDLSYQFLLNVYPFDSLLNRQVTVNRMRKDAETTRNALLGEIGRTVIRAGLGYSPEENFATFNSYLQDYYMRKKYADGAAKINWLREVPADFLNKMNEHAQHFRELRYSAHPELLEAFRIMLGLRANTEMLINLLPMMEDFQTALAGGMSPAQAYEHLVARELGYDASALRSYPTEALAATRNDTPAQDYAAHNARLCEQYRRFTGAVPEQEQGEDGKTYWRLRRPGGTYSRWHESAAAAMNDVAANAALLFLPLGYDVQGYWQGAARRGGANLTLLPYAQEGEFSGYDQLCSYAFRDLTHHWLESAYHLQPGLRVEELRKRFVHNPAYANGINPVFLEQPEGEGASLRFDLHTLATPHGLAHARFYTYWQRLLGSGALRAEDAHGMLEACGVLQAEDAAAWAAAEGEEGRRAAMAGSLAEFTLMCYMARMPELPLPPTVKEWYAYAPFCPPEPVAEEMPRSVPLGRRGAGIVQWSNRRVATALAEFAPRVEALRSLVAQPLPHARLESLLQGALGLDAAQAAEQVWCCHRCGEGPLHTVPAAYWQLLQEPLQALPRLSAAEQARLHDYLMPTCVENALPMAEPAQDAVQAALANLDRVVQAHPELHAYSLAGADAAHVWYTRPPAAPQHSVPPLAEPRYTPLPLYQGQGVSGEPELYALPAAEFPLLAEPGVPQALRVLDALRSYPAGLPYALEGGIYWHNQPYGGQQGARPVGLEQHEPMPAMPAVLRLLEEVHELCRHAETPFLDFRGVPIPHLTAEQLYCPELRNVTVYRRQQVSSAYADDTHLVRLMPGSPLAHLPGGRSPYVVDVRAGVYMQGGRALRADDGANACMVPLQEFEPAPLRPYSAEHRRAWADRMLEDSLERLGSIAERGPDFMVDRLCGGIPLPELLMRLYEDTNFSQGVIGNRGMGELRMQELRALRLAADIIACVAAPRSATDARSLQAFRNLQKTLRLFRAPNGQRELLEHVFRRGNREIWERSSYPLNTYPRR